MSVFGEKESLTESEIILLKRKNAVMKKNLSIIGMVMAVIIGLVSIKNYREASSVLLKLDESKLDQIYLGK